MCEVGTVHKIFQGRLVHSATPIAAVSLITRRIYGFALRTPDIKFWFCFQETNQDFRFEWQLKKYRTKKSSAFRITKSVTPIIQICIQSDVNEYFTATESSDVFSGDKSCELRNPTLRRDCLHPSCHPYG